MAPKKATGTSRGGAASSAEPSSLLKKALGCPLVKKSSSKAKPAKAETKHTNGTYRWDDWVPQDRLRKLTEDNLQLAKDLRKEMTNVHQEKKAAAKKPSKAARESTRATSSPAPQPATKKRNRDQETEKEDIYETSLRIELNLPDMVASILVDDWENVTKHLQLPLVPAPIPANQVFDEWFAYEAKQRAPDTASIDKLKELVEGLKIYFKYALGKVLLYRFERFQYSDIYHRTTDPNDELAGKTMGEIYGPEHVLRLLSQMPEYASHSGMERQDLLYLKEELQRLANWIIKPQNMDRYFSEPYRATNKEYQDRWKWSNGL